MGSEHELVRQAARDWGKCSETRENESPDHARANVQEKCTKARSMAEVRFFS
ncbi:hypothetical protein MA16_Dca003893 [Dendrobium catenatum]|uniref:Uncharacterized protein n=1 Tax=Dendrobium catenatum TaxID=906689 RepID=A0A2I0X1T7_9ASPA|nr:hypothetical protein MA16_Dca003893 [Dendrobium catenatum]